MIEIILFAVAVLISRFFTPFRDHNGDFNLEFIEVFFYMGLLATLVWNLWEIYEQKYFGT
jgi:hypothetical protein